jgi:ATP-dependent RNA helicase DDX42
MTKALKEAPEIVIATPGRFIDLANARATNLSRCTMVVLDEADRMFEMGFEYQVRSIVNNIRPDRQTVLFSATMKKKLEGFAREILNDPIRVVIGSIGQANPDIAQVVDVVEDVKDKWMWLLRRIDGWVRDGKVLIFAGGKGDTEEVAGGIRSHFASNGVLCGIDCLHGDKSQADRSQILRKFRTGELSILVATDVASRGLDIKEVRTVVNYSAARNIETHVHRIGRTGRMGVDGVTPGTAHTVLVSSLPSDASLAVDLLKNLQDAGQGSSISPELRRLAESSPRWMRMGSHRGGGRGAGNGSRPSSFGVGLGAPNAPRAMTSSMLAAATPAQGRASGKSFPPSSTGLGTSASGNAMGFPPTSTSHQAASNNRSVEYHKSTSPVLSGFVRSSDTLSSPSHQPSNSGSSMESNGSSKPASDQPQVRKRSRWDS